MTTFLDAKAAQARIAELEAKLAEATKPKAITFKVSEKGAVSVLGLQRFPVTLYYQQWMRLFDSAPDLVKFMEKEKANAHNRAQSGQTVMQTEKASKAA